uniref:Peptidase M13 N-terminal domain-containing protein n=1 Tax=Ditylenchus dipsaci TaxID=166011 RepID=A0A915ENF0_9BILA
MSDYLEMVTMLDQINNLDQRFVATVSGDSFYLKYDCKNKALEYFPQLIDQLYVNRFYDEEAKTETIKTMYKYMDEAFRDIIEESTWMDEDTKDKALEKLDQMELFVGYIPSIFDKKKIIERYGKFKLTPQMSFVEMVWKAREWDTDYYASLNSRTGREYYWNTLDVNTYYHWDYNVLFIVAAFLQTPARVNVMMEILLNLQKLSTAHLAPL